MPAQRRSAYARAPRQLIERLADHGVAHIFASRDRRQSQAGGQVGRHVFQRMHRQVDAAVQQGLFQFLREEPFRRGHGPERRKRYVRDPVAGGLDDLNAGLNALVGEALLNVVGLPKRELRTA